jgi:cytochrome b6-f complex iron-sulfur subunit
VNAVSDRQLRRYVEDLLHGRRPRPFRPNDDEAAEIRAAITLRAGGAGSGEPSQEFVTGLRDRLAAELAESGGTTTPVTTIRTATRRRAIQLAAAAATAGVAAGAALDRVLAGAAEAAPAVQAQQTLRPDAGTWRTVAASADLGDGAVRAVDLGTVSAFVERSEAGLRAVSGICTHLGCHLALNAPARELTCPCHNAAFALDGRLVRYELRTPPPALPELAVREVEGSVQIFAPTE